MRVSLCTEMRKADIVREKGTIQNEFDETQDLQFTDKIIRMNFLDYCFVWLSECRQSRSIQMCSNIDTTCYKQFFFSLFCATSSTTNSNV